MQGDRGTQLTENQVKGPIYAGLFFISLAILTYEILLTRIFSVTMYYHFAFVAISVAMFGMTLGTILVFLYPSYFTPERAKFQLALSSLLFAATVVVSFLVHLCVPFAVHKSLTGIFSIGLFYSVISTPFVFGGICVSLALTRFPRRVGKLYAADLAGAALGCIMLIGLLAVTDGISAVFAVATMACLGSLAFAVEANSPVLRRWVLLCTVGIASFTVFHSVLAAYQLPLRFDLMWANGGETTRPLYEKWNSFSRFIIYGNADQLEPPFGWGLSSVCPTKPTVKQLQINIDSNARTVLTAFDGDTEKLWYLKYDVTNIAHWIKKNADVLVIGSGGGRDLLSALAFKQNSVLGVEINGDIMKAVNGRYGDFTGHIDRNPKVRLVNDEARSYITRSSEKFDIIQASLIDTWAATAAGAFVLSENSLYTTEAWVSFMEHLKPGGVISFSRWYVSDNPASLYRLTTMAVDSLSRIGVSDPRRSIVIVSSKKFEMAYPIGTILVRREPYTDVELDTLEKVAKDMEFDIVLSPRRASDPNLAILAERPGPELASFLKSYPLNISAPTDDQPFFFHMLPFTKVFDTALRNASSIDFNIKAIFNLVTLTVVVLVLTVICIVVPLILKTEKLPPRGSLALFLLFSSIGLAFMFIEVSQMQRLIVFLGHPTYGLSVVLFSLLLSSSAGSFLTEFIENPVRSKVPALLLVGLVVVITASGLIMPVVTHYFEAASTPVRIAVATLMLFPIGVFMGMPFPLGMKLASLSSIGLTPWLWGINGAMSVCASVVAIVISISWGISATYWTGLAFYLFALVAFIAIPKPKDQRVTQENAAFAHGAL
jgi:hypothetical protein